MPIQFKLLKTKFQKILLRERTYFNLGLAYGKIGQKDKEIEAYERAIKLNRMLHQLISTWEMPTMKLEKNKKR